MIVKLNLALQLHKAEIRQINIILHLILKVFFCVAHDPGLPFIMCSWLPCHTETNGLVDVKPFHNEMGEGLYEIGPGPTLLIQSNTTITNVLHTLSLGDVAFKARFERSIKI